MSFHDVRFPTDISYGSAGGPGFKTSVITLDSGAEERNSRWSAPRRRYDVAYGVKDLADLRTLKEFFIARDGAANSFRYKDWLDFKSCENMDNSVDPEDVQIGTGDGSETQFQLVKKYTSGGYERTRNITTPVSGTVRVAIDGVEQLSGWSVNTTTGVVTFTSAPALNEVVTAGFQFDVPVRFSEAVDEILSLSIDMFDTGSAPAIEVIEVLDDTAVNGEFFYGGSQAIQISVDTAITIQDGRVQEIDPQSSGLSVLLPDTTGLVTGGPYFYIENTSGSNSFDLDEDDGTNITTLAPGDQVIVLLGGSGWVVIS